MGRWNGTVAAVAGAVVVGLLAGCAGEGEPKERVTSEAALPTTDPPVAPEPSPSPDAPESGAPTPTTLEPPPATTPPPTPVMEVAQPEVPPEAQTNDAEGALAFTQYAVEMMGYSYAMGEVEHFLGISHPDCDSCNLQMEQVQVWTDDGFVLLEGSFPIETVYQVRVADTGVDYLVDLRLAHTNLLFYAEEYLEGADYQHVEEWQPQDLTYVVQFLEPGMWQVLGIYAFDPATGTNP
ncbi:MAG: DUF6318 family protein [bacterium]|nr:DUF6318 family protein [bacterium]